MSERRVAGRRRFIAAAGAALTMPLAAPGASSAAADAQAQLAVLEDTAAIRDLHRAYLRSFAAGAPQDAVALFVDAARAVPPAGVVALADDPSHDADELEIAANRVVATLRTRCLVTVETPIEAPGCTLLEMARLQGEGVVRRIESRALVLACARREGAWKIERIELLAT